MSNSSTRAKKTGFNPLDGLNPLNFEQVQTDKNVQKSLLKNAVRIPRFGDPFSFRIPNAESEVRTITIEGEPWFVGKDVAEVLGYQKPLNALATHVDEDDSLKQGLIDSLGRMQQTIFINESGLYSLILSSKLPQAKEFKRWVTSEVLPKIRRHGMYATEELLENPDIARTTRGTKSFFASRVYGAPHLRNTPNP